MSRADELRALHIPGDPLVLVNVWDVASARVVASTQHCRALATASWSVAAVHGYPDGEALPLDVALATLRRIADAVALPVSADLEAGYGDPAETVAQAVEAGAAGCNLEDRAGLAASFAASIAAVRERSPAVVINARSDEYLLGESRPDEVLTRGHAYLEVGADCFFVPGLADLETIRRLADALEGRVSVLATPRSPSLAQLKAAGVARVSFGPGTLGVASAALGAATEVLLAGGAYPPELALRPPA